MILEYVLCYKEAFLLGTVFGLLIAYWTMDSQYKNG